MPILDYISKPQSRPRRERWIVVALLAALIGAAAGLGVAAATLDWVLSFLADGVQLQVSTVTEPMDLEIRFTASVTLCGVLVACGAVMADRLTGGGRLVLWVATLGACFTIAAVGELFHARSSWKPAAGSPLWLFRTLPITSVPILAAPIAGCIAVLAVLGLVLLRRMSATRRAN